MSHTFKVGQLVALAHVSRDLETYEVVQLMPETVSGEPQYRIKGLASDQPACSDVSSGCPAERQHRDDDDGG